jgi:hypothetical protein
MQLLMTPCMVWFLNGFYGFLEFFFIKTQNKTRITFCKLDIFVGQKMSKTEKVLEMLFGTLEFTTTLWIPKVDALLDARGGARRATDPCN